MEIERIKLLIDTILLLLNSHTKATHWRKQISSSGSAAAPTMKQILSNVSGSANPGEILALMGPSGSGKTTLLDCLSNRGIISSGTISINGAPLSKRHKRSIAYVMQNDIFFDHLTVRDQLLYVIPNQTQEPEPIKD